MSLSILGRAAAWLAAEVRTAEGALTVAAFAGAVLALGFVKNLSRRQMAFAVLIGFGTSYYCTPLALLAMKIPDEPGHLKYGVAFLIGLFAMQLIPLGKELLKRRLGGVPR